MVNVGGPNARGTYIKLQGAVVHFILRYGCKIWANALKTETCRKWMALARRRGTLRTSSSCWTVSEPDDSDSWGDSHQSSDPGM